MKRRRLLQSLLSPLPVPLAAGIIADPARARAADPTRARRLLLQKSPLAGFQYHAGEWLWPWLAIGTPLELVREAHDPHDARAVAVHFVAGTCIGNATVSQLLDRGERSSARVAALRESRDPWQRLSLAINWEPTA